MRESIVFYKSFHDAIKELPAEQQAHLYNAIFDYQFNGIEPTLDNGIENAVWKLIKPLLEANNERFENGKKGGRPKKEKPSVTKNKTIGYENENHRLEKNTENKNLMSNELCVMSNVKENVKRKFTPPTIEEVEAYVQEKQLNVDAKKFWDYFDTGGWVDSKGNKVKNWKQKILTWNKFADEAIVPKASYLSNKYYDESAQYDEFSNFYDNL